MSGGLRDAVEALRAEWRLDFRVAERVLAALAGGGSIGEVVAWTAADRHEVEDVLRRLEPWLRRDGERYVLIEAAAEIGAAGETTGAASETAAPGETAAVRETATSDETGADNETATSYETGADNETATSDETGADDEAGAADEARATGEIGPVPETSEETRVAADTAGTETPDEAGAAGETGVLDETGVHGRAGAVGGVVDRRALAAAMAEIAAGLPEPDSGLDHVLARPATMAARAGYFAERYALAGTTVLCVGDHDLTSVAIALAEPAAEVLVVDIDQRVLGYIEQVAAERGLAITTAFADLRLGLPASFAGQADLVFTDPPYTPDGVGLFLTRGLQGLRRSGHERIALAYGFANRQLARGFRTQAVLHELRLVLEALLPGFNRFGGAEAIGSASDLYVCRPTRFSWPVIERATTGDPRIYTRGAAATESAPATLPASIVDEVRAALGAEQAAYVGDGWPAGGNRRQVGLAEYLAASPHRRRPVAVNLYPHFGAVLPQAMLAAAVAERAVLVAPAKDVEAIVDSPVWTLLAGTDIEARPGTESGLLVLRRAGQPSTPAGRVYEFLVRHPEAKVGNAWRDALVTAATRGTEDAEDASAGAPLTKNQARALIQAAGVPERALHLRLGELPMDTLATLAAAVARAVRPVAQ